MIDENAKEKRAKRVQNKKAKAENLNSISHYDESLNADVYKPPKKWKEVYLRSEKMRRAKQLGFEYPKKSTRQMLDALEK